MSKHPQNSPKETNFELLTGKDELEQEPAVFDLIHEQVRFRQNPVEFLASIRRHVLGKNWRSYETYIGARLYYAGWRDAMLEETLTSPVVQNAISDLVERRMNVERSWEWTPKELEERRTMYTACVREMVHSIGLQAMPYFETVGKVKATYWLVAQTFSRCYHQGVHISRSDVEKIRNKALELEAKKQSLLLFPCHKSHIDYLSLVFTFFRLGLSLPVTVAGDNLNIPVIHRVLRDCGALYIRRGRWSGDKLYSAFFQAVIETFLKNGVNFQCFIEGTRSRTGKLLPPRFGILKFILETLLSGAVKDAWVLPISTQYDKVVEADTYATELLGREKKAESLSSILKSSTIISLKLGRVDIRFGEIWSLREFLIEQLQMEATTSFPLAQPLAVPQKNHLLRTLGYRILSDINHASAIMPSALVGTALLTSSRRGLARTQLIQRVSWLINRVIAAGGNIGALAKDPKQLDFDDVSLLVDNAISVLGSSLVRVESKNLLENVYYTNHEFKLSYYRNQTVFLFINEAIVSISIFTLSQNIRFEIMYEELQKKARFLSHLFANEFVYGVESLDENLNQILSELEKADLISLHDNGTRIKLHMHEIQNDIRQFELYCYMVWPYIDGYWSTILSLYVLPAGRKIAEKDFLQMAQLIARTLYAQGELLHSEALNKEMIKFAVQSYAEQGIVVFTHDDETNNSYLHLTPEYQPKVSPDGKVLLEGPLYEIAEELALSRNKPLRFGLSRTITQRLIDLCVPAVATLSVPRL